MKKRKTLVIFLTIMVFGVIFTNINKKEHSFMLLYKDTDKEKGKHFLYSDNEGIYFIKDYKPQDIFVMLSNKKISNSVYFDAKENFKNNKYNFFAKDGGHVEIYNLVYAINNLDVHMSELTEHVKLEKEDFKYDEYEIINVVCNENIGEQIFYKDRYGISIYTDGIEAIYVKYNEKIYNLKDIMIKNNSISDNVYYILSKDGINSSYWFETDVINGINNGNLRIINGFSNNERFYKIYCLDNFIKENILISN